MKIKIEKKNDEKYLILFSDDSQVQGVYVTKSELKKLKSDISQIMDYDAQEIGDPL